MLIDLQGETAVDVTSDAACIMHCFMTGCNHASVSGTTCYNQNGAVNLVGDPDSYVLVRTDTAGSNMLIVKL